MSIQEVTESMISDRIKKKKRIYMADPNQSFENP